MVQVTTKQILLLIYSVAFVCCIISLATEGGIFNKNSTREKAYAAFLIIGAISTAVVFVIELLGVFVASIKANGTVGYISIAFLFLSGISLIICCCIYYSHHFPFGWTVAACTLMMEAVLMFLVAQFCSG